MGWKGIAIGGVLGGIAGRSLLGALLGALIGHQVQRRMGTKGRSAAARRRASDPLAAAYSTLGARPTDSADELVRKYRALAKRHHPDVARARGLSEREAERAAGRMARINDAWALIRAARGM